MKRAFVLLAAITVAMIWGATPALAWHATASGSAVCDEDTGDWIVTWTVNNDVKENETGTISDSDRASVPDGSTIPAKGSVSFEEVLPGTTTGTLSLSVHVTWPSDQEGFDATGSAVLEGSCEAPPPPEDECADTPNPNDVPPCDEDEQRPPPGDECPGLPNDHEKPCQQPDKEQPDVKVLSSGLDQDDDVLPVSNTQVLPFTGIEVEDYFGFALGLIAAGAFLMRVRFGRDPSSR